tara:strand:- start:3807 stop:4148 length:342 start_codon:yes stop_codon:yes gene_type:complete
MNIDSYRWDETAAGTNSGAQADHTAEASSNGSSPKTHVITSISGHTDLDGLIQILGGAAGATVIWESSIDVSAEGFSFNFPGLNVHGDPGIAISGHIVGSTANCQVNISGYSL